MLLAQDVAVRFRKGFRRKPIQALDGLTIEVREGDFLALIGENGAGKSTAMYCFLGLIRPNRGTIRLLGERPDPGKALYGKVGYLPEEPHYHLYLTVEEAVTYYVSLFRKAVSRQQVAQILEHLGLAEFHNLRLSKCSKGMKQKVGIAQCLLHAPSLLFLDEPMRGLDPIIVREFRQILSELHRQGVTVVMNSHILSEVEALATRVAVLDRGRVVAEDSIGNFTRSASDVYLVEFEGTGNAVPPFLTVESRGDHAISGSIPAASFHEFNDWARAQRLRVLSCILKKRSLEDSFFSIVKGRTPDA